MEQQFIKSLKAALEIEGHEVELNDEFRQYPEWDSLNRLSLMAMLDEEYGVQLDEDTFNQARTVADLIEAVKQRK